MGKLRKKRGWIKENQTGRFKNERTEGERRHTQQVQVGQIDNRGVIDYGLEGTKKNKKRADAKGQPGDIKKVDSVISFESKKKVGGIHGAVRPAKTTWKGACDPEFKSGGKSSAGEEQGPRSTRQRT